VFTAKSPHLAVFAPNGHGKSSLVDAIEFLLSPTTTLPQFGSKETSNLAGPRALEHVLAEQKGVDPSVCAEITDGAKVHAIRRSVADTAVPDLVTKILTAANVGLVIRGHELRRFVESESEEERYAQVAGWLHLTPLVQAQQTLRALRADLKKAAYSEAQFDAINSLVNGTTKGGIEKWDVAKAVIFVNDKAICPLDPAVAIKGLDESDESYKIIVGRSTQEAEKLGLAGLKQVDRAARLVWSESANDDGTTEFTGALAEFETAVETLGTALEKMKEEEGLAADAALKDIWEAAQRLYAQDAIRPDACPVCQTTIEDSPSASADGVHSHVSIKLDGISSYASARKCYDDALGASLRSQETLTIRLTSLAQFDDTQYADLTLAVASYLADIAHYSSDTHPDSTSVKENIVATVVGLADEIETIEKLQGEHTWAGAKSLIDQMRVIAAQFESEWLRVTELRALHASLETASIFISARIRDTVQSLLDQLLVPMNAIYQKIQGVDAVRLRLDLPAEEAKVQQRLLLRIDFADNREGVPPSGYLSDSQIHSVALAFRFAAATQFNRQTPFLVLDDVVTSYDADHRRSIAMYLGELSEDLQLIVTTHDDRFFAFMRDVLKTSSWNFRQITAISRDSGPSIEGVQIPDETIAEFHRLNKSAANQMRQAEEEWLIKLARAFNVRVVMRPTSRPFAYERSELADGIGGVLNAAGLSIPVVPGVQNSFLQSLATGAVENFGSHFQAGTWGFGSIGDERTRWSEFTYFRDQFRCPQCNKTRLLRPTSKTKPYCADKKCEAVFAFPEATAP